MFSDRADAGRQLARRLLPLRGDDVVVVGLARGGVPVALEVANRLGVPLDVLVVRKLGVPGRPEVAMGAVGEGEVLVVHDRVVRAIGLSRDEFEAVVARERAEVAQRVLRLRGTRRRVDLAGKVVVVVDDGVATGSTAKAGCLVVRAAGARRVVLAEPVGPKGLADTLDGVADEVVCLATPRLFRSVGEFYDDFSQVSDEQVSACLQPAAAERLDRTRPPD